MRPPTDGRDRIAEAAEDRRREALDAHAGADVERGLGERRHGEAGQRPEAGGERERRRHHAVGADPDEARGVAPDRRGPHGAPERRPAIQVGERDDGDGGQEPDPDRLALDGRPEPLERGSRR